MSLSMEQKQAIQEMLAAGAYAYDERDMEALAAGFTEDATMSMRIAGGDLIGPFEGREAIMGLMRGAMDEQTDVRRHVIANSFYDESGEHPVVTSVLTLIATENGITRLLATGIYRDTVVERDGRWCLLKRHIDLDAPY